MLEARKARSFQICLKYEECISEIFIKEFSNIENCVQSTLQKFDQSKNFHFTMCTKADIEDCVNAISLISCDNITTLLNFQEPELCKMCLKK